MAPQTETQTELVSSLPIDASFVNRLIALPVVHSALDFAHYYYDGTKTRYQFVGKVESQLTDAIAPTVNALSLRLSPLDHLACSTLNVLEKKVPLITQTPSEIIQTFVAPVESLLSYALSVSEHKVDTLLPGEESEALTEKNNGQIRRAQALGEKIRGRLSKRAQKQLEQFEKLKKSPHEIQKLITVDLLQYSITSLDFQLSWLKQNLGQILQTLQKDQTQLFNLLDQYSKDVKLAIINARENIEKSTPASFKEASSSAVTSLSQRIVDFTDKLRTTLHQLDAYKSNFHNEKNQLALQKLSDTVDLSLTYIQEFANSLISYTSPKSDADLKQD